MHHLIFNCRVEGAEIEGETGSRSMPVFLSVYRTSGGSKFYLVPNVLAYMHLMLTERYGSTGRAGSSGGCSALLRRTWRNDCA